MRDWQRNADVAQLEITALDLREALTCPKRWAKGEVREDEIAYDGRSWCVLGYKDGVYTLYELVPAPFQGDLFCEGRPITAPSGAIVVGPWGSLWRVGVRWMLARGL